MPYAPDYWRLLRERNQELNWVGNPSDRQYDTVQLPAEGVGESVNLHVAFNSIEIIGLGRPNISVVFQVKNSVIDNQELVDFFTDTMLLMGQELAGVAESGDRFRLLIGRPLETDANGMEMKQAQPIWENYAIWHSVKLDALSALYHEFLAHR